MTISRVRPKVALSVGILVALAAAVVLWLLLKGDSTSTAPEGPIAAEGLVTTEDPFRFEMVYGQCGLASIVAPSGITLPENEVFCVVEFHLLNRSGEARILDPSCQFMLDGEGTRHAQRTDVLHIDPTSRKAFLRPVPPGRLLEHSALYFDVAKGTRADAVELHSSCGSRGVLLDVVRPPREQ